MAVHRTTKGLDIPLAGEPVQAIGPAAPATRVGIVGADFIGIKPSLLVQPGDVVRRGQPLFADKAAHGVVHTAPAAGTVRAVNRGEMRAFQSLVIDVDDSDGPDAQVAFASFTGRAPAEIDAATVRALLVESGMWTAFRTRPYSRVPAADTVPHAIFVTAMDTRPHAPVVDVVLAGRDGDFHAGLAAIARLCPERTWLCKAEGSGVNAPPGLHIGIEEFGGPHPAGTPGLHIHVLSPVDAERTVWHIGYQDVAAIGRLFATGRLDFERIVSLAGPGVVRPRLLRTRLGVALDPLTHGELAPGEQRVISGSALDGRAAAGEVFGYLGRYHQQIAVVPEGRERQLFGYLAPGRDKFSIWGVTVGAWTKGRRLPLTTSTNGGRRAMVPIGAYERVMPLDLMPTFLLRALLTDDAERAEALGCLELDEDDLALCTFVCPGKIEYGPLLRSMLARLEKEHAA